MSDTLIALLVSLLILALMAAWVPFLHGCHHVVRKIKPSRPMEQQDDSEESYRPAVLRRTRAL